MPAVIAHAATGRPPGAAHPTGQGWQPATIEDLVADALALGVDTASARMITDWTEDGLLGSPAFQKSTGYGSDARLYPAL